MAFWKRLWCCRGDFHRLLVRIYPQPSGSSENLWVSLFSYNISVCCTEKKMVPYILCIAAALLWPHIRQGRAAGNKWQHRASVFPVMSAIKLPLLCASQRSICCSWDCSRHQNVLLYQIWYLFIDNIFPFHAMQFLFFVICYTGWNVIRAPPINDSWQQVLILYIICWKHLNEARVFRIFRSVPFHVCYRCPCVVLS